MNKASAFLLLSLAANAALAVLVHNRLTPPSPAPPSANASATSDLSRTGSPGAAGAAEPDISPAHTDDARYVARLRAGGMPPDLIRALVQLRIQARYRDRTRALLSAGTDRYWLGWSASGLHAASPEARAKLRALFQQANDEIRALLGEGPDALSPYERRLYDQMTGILSNEKIQQVEAIRKDYDDLAARVREQGRGLVLRADREQLRLIERERRADLAATLTAEELLEYDLRTSPTASAVRNRLNFFEPTEDEFRALATLQLEFDQQYGRQNLSGEEQDRRRDAEKELTARIQTVLPADRFKDYLVTIDGMYSETSRFVASYDLDPAVTKEIVALKQDTWRRIEELDRAGLDAQQRNAALREIEQDVNARLSDRLGAEISANYRRSGAGWMNRLRPNPAPSGP